MKYDCNKTADFFHEARRICSNRHGVCKDCPLYDICDNKTHIDIFFINEPIITNLQKWSDENPEETRKDYFFKCFPNAERNEEGCPLQCCKSMGLATDCIPNGKCKDCWNMPK